VNFIQEPLLDLPALDTVAAVRRPLVAVLPFQAARDDAALRLLGGDIADLLRERLERDPALQAILISSDFLAKAPPHAVELICRELRVGYLISGKCHGSIAAPSLYVEVTDTRDWHIHWAHFYREDARALLCAGDDTMNDLVASLRRLLVEHPAR
jgi:TolB-like protein